VGDERVWVAEDGGRVCGFASIGPARDEDLPPGSGELFTIYLEPEAWSRGLGRALFEAAVADMRERRYEPIVLWVLTESARGRHFYEAAGWRPDSASRILDFDGTPIEEIRYRPSIRPDPRTSRTIGSMDAPAQSPSVPDRILRFIDAPRFASIATIDPDGGPRQAVIWYLVEGDVLVINSLDGRRWPANLRRDPRISFTITDAEDGYNWIGLTGEVVDVSDDQVRAQADIAAMARLYHADDPQEAEDLIRNRFEKQHRVSFRVRITGFHDHLED
jgi:PPOX class probable F420-dependent enzyme